MKVGKVAALAVAGSVLSSRLKMNDVFSHTELISEGLGARAARLTAFQIQKRRAWIAVTSQEVYHAPMARPENFEFPWKLFPLFGLSVEEDDGLANPIFGDATLVSVETAKDFIRTRYTPEHVEVFTRPLPRDETATEPRKYLLEVFPDSFIAVMRGEENDAHLRAGELRAMLTATLALRGYRLQAFADRAAPLSWSVDYGGILASRSTPIEISAKRVVSLNRHVIRTPLVVSKAALRGSWEHGSEISKSVPGWDIHKSHALCQLFSRAVLTDFIKTLRMFAQHLTQAFLADSYEHQILMAVTCIEGLMCTQEWDDVRRRAMALNINALPGGYTLNDVFGARHLYIHQAKSPENPEKMASQALLYGWVFLDRAATFVQGRPSHQEWVDFLQFVSLRSDMRASLEKNFGGSESAEAFDRLVRDSVAKAGVTAGNYTLRLSPPTEQSGALAPKETGNGTAAGSQSGDTKPSLPVPRSSTER